MSRPALIAAGLAFALSAPVHAQWAPPANVQGGYGSSRAAESQCKNQLRSQYGVSNTRAVTTNDRGNGRFQVQGNADRNNQTSNFNCWVESNSVRNLSVGNWQNYNGGGNNSGGNAVAAVGAALVLGAIIAAASSKKKSHEYDQYPDGYGDGQNGGNDSYSPAGGINCYRQQRACFDGNNNYNAGWTSREFGY